MTLKIEVQAESFRLAQAFRISRGAKTEAQVITVTLRDGPHAGRGECVPYARYGESLDSVAGLIRGLPRT